VWAAKRNDEANMVDRVNGERLLEQFRELAEAGELPQRATNAMVLAGVIDVWRKMGALAERQDKLRRELVVHRTVIIILLLIVGAQLGLPLAGLLP
jgi:hypothetical protein